MFENQTVKIKIWGIVQGVGFRPFVAKLADRCGMKGEVLNIGGLVDIIVSDTAERIELFLEALKKEKPLPAEIVHIKTEIIPYRDFTEFKILDSDEGDDEAAMIPADLSICPDCLDELQDSDNPRYMHPFISCMACGPRYTIIDKIPYDRENTSMVEFPMCEFCNSEYTDRQDRRYHAQTISCHDCGPMLLYKLPEKGKQEAVSVGIIGLKANNKIQKKAIDPIALASMLIIQDGVIALKGVGGFNLICSPFKEKAVKKLRAIKEREEKPFAVMFKDMDQIKEYCYVNEQEEKLLCSSARPIVLLERKSVVGRENQSACSLSPIGDERLIVEEVYKSSRFIGAFLPSMGVQFMLINICGPLVVTSANLSEQPIIKDDEEMLHLLPSLDGIFYNERKIRIRLDDSVVREIDGQPQMIRRSKGYAPVPLYINSKLSKKDMILACGGQLKAAFSLSKGPFAYVSQYFGDLDSREAFQIYESNIGRMGRLFRIDPGLVVCDLHPLYETTKYAERYGKEHGIDLLKIQHHHAHVASVVAEHDINGPVIGVSFDGTGYGTDGAIWGGEFLICDGLEFQRFAHLEYIKMLGGDSSMKEGWKSAMSYIHHYSSADGFEQFPGESCLDAFPFSTGLERLNKGGGQNWPIVQSALANSINTINSSSMGRLFDAVSAFLGIQAINRYEGECAIMLENCAAEALLRDEEPYDMEFTVIPQENSRLIRSDSLFFALEKGMRDGVGTGRLALGFHFAVSKMILQVCESIKEEKGIQQAALTGGVFQNKILMELTLKQLRDAGFTCYYNVSVGPNDGGICFGQNYLGMLYLNKKIKDN